MLSTPPAFILSQDQTLVKSFFRQDQPFWLIHPFLLFSASSEAEAHQKSSSQCSFFEFLSFKKFSRIVVYCLVIKVHLCSLSSDSLFILSHPLSFVKNFFQVFEVFSNLFLLGFLLRVSLYILPCCFLFVKSVFSFFYNFFSHFRLTSQPPYLSGRKSLFFLYISKANGEGGI